MCTVSPDSGTVCSFECRHGFSENGGVSMILCGNDGNWTKNESSILQCLGNCFVNYYINIDPNMCTLYGETGRNINTRLTGHKRALKNGDANNHIAVHHQLTNHFIDWDCSTLESWYTNLEQTSLNICR